MRTLEEIKYKYIGRYFELKNIYEDNYENDNIFIMKCTDVGGTTHLHGDLLQLDLDNSIVRYDIIEFKLISCIKREISKDEYNYYKKKACSIIMRGE